MGKALSGELSCPCDRSCLKVGQIRQQREREGVRFSYAVPKIQWIPTAPVAARVWETFALQVE